MNPILNKIKGWWLAATPNQRLTTLGGGALTLVLVAAIASYAGKPKFTLMYGGLSPAEQAAVVTEIQAMGIPVQYDTAGSVEVPEGKSATVQMRLAQADKLPKQNHTVVDSKGGLFQTPAEERQKLKALQESQLAAAIQTIPGVRTAQVNITLGDLSPFGDQQRPPTASVKVGQGGSGMLNAEQAQGIAMLVANSVDGLQLKNVVVLDDRAVPIFNGAESAGTENRPTKKIELEDQVARAEGRKLQAALDTMFGPGATLVTVRAELDLDDEESTVNTRKVLDGVEVEKSSENAPMSGGGTPAFPSGMAANTTPGAPTAPPTPGSGGRYTNEVKRIEPGFKESVVKKTKATGGIKRMLINVGADTGRFDDPAKADEFVQSVEAYVRNEFKNQSDTASFQAFVVPAKFNRDAQEIMAKSQEESASAAKRQQIISLLPVGALMLVGFFVVKSLGKFGKANFGGGMTPAMAGALPGSGTYAFSGAPGSGRAPGLPVGRGASPLETALAGHFEGGSPLGLPGVGGNLDVGGIEFESDDERIRITKIKERTSIPLEQIRQMSIERPEAVAMLVKSWLMDEKR